MKLYLIGGLGADERVFQDLQLDTECQLIEWIDPLESESLSSYVNRLIPQINQNETFGMLGVSFGGIVAIELAKIIKPEVLILISTVENDRQLPKKYVNIAKLGVLNLIPTFLIKPPKFLQTYLFGATNKKLLHKIIRDTKPTFIRWALNSIINWKNTINSTKIIRIHGTKDKLIPIKGEAIKIKGGGHFMIVDNAEEISNLVNEKLRYAG